jgi:hypothetical protein
MNITSFSIPAEVHSDDHAAEASFDAAPWFRQASDQDIKDLIECGFRGDYPADEVAQWEANVTANEEVIEVFTYVCTRRNVADIGFECSVDEDAAFNWLRANRLNLIPVES